tara:strand:+ start:4339 stop:4440 length:102 start_codon:yes stop_codon:yes gene_type:complete
MAVIKNRTIQTGANVAEKPMSENNTHGGRFLFL